MKPKMVILNSTEYYEFFDQAIARSLEQKHQEALNLLLELKEKRWIRFDLFKMIAEEYMALGQYDESQIMINKLNPLNEEQKQELIELQETLSKKWALDQENLDQGLDNNLEENKDDELDHNFDEIIFMETEELLLQHSGLETEIVIDSSLKFDVVNLDSLLFLANKGYFQTFEKFAQFLFLPIIYQNFKIQNPSKALGLVYVSLTFEKYHNTLKLLEDFYQDSEALSIKGFCQQQLKQYKLAAKIYRTAFELDKKQLPKYYLQCLCNLFCYQQISIPPFIIDSIQMYIFNHQRSKYIKMLPQRHQIKQILLQKYLIYKGNNTQMFLYHELFQMEYHISIYNPILQRICDFLIKYAPKYSAGYANQYQLLIDQKQMDEAFALEQPLLQCEDCTLKFITLAKLYKEQSKFLEAHKAIEKARQIDPFKEEIYQIQSEVFMGQKKYQQAYQSIRQLVELEKENYFFIQQIMASIINKYEFYRVFDLLQLVDQHSRKLVELKLLMRIISDKSEQENFKILELIKLLNNVQMMIFQGHYQLSKKNIKQAVEFYDQIYKEIRFKENQRQSHLIRDSIDQIRSSQQINQLKIIDVICQISICEYTPSQERFSLIHKRYTESVGFVLVSLIYDQNIDQTINFINSNFDMEVPKIKDFKQKLISIIQRIYVKINPQTYEGYLNQGILQLQSLFISSEVFLNQFYQFSDQHKQLMIEQFNGIDHENYQLDQDMMSIFSFPFFYDPISRYALMSVVKMIGYSIEFELVNNYQNIDEWLQVHMVKLNYDEYYKQIKKK